MVFVSPSFLTFGALLAPLVAAAPTEIEPRSASGFPTQKSKWGVPWAKNGNLGLDINNFLGRNGWFYNWETSGQPLPSNDMPFVPQFNTLNSDWEAYFTNDVLNNQGNFPAKTVMMFNEPDNPNTPVSPADACGAWKKYFAPLKSAGWKIIGPSLANPKGNWYPQFKDQCSEVESQIDFGNLHYYQTDSNVVIDSATTWNKQFGKPVYISEVTCWTFDGTQCNGEGDAENFLKTVANWAAGQDWVNGIAPFGFWKPSAGDDLKGGVGSFDALANDDGTPSNLYNAWASAGN